MPRQRASTPSRPPRGERGGGHELGTSRASRAHLLAPIQPNGNFRTSKTGQEAKREKKEKKDECVPRVTGRNGHRQRLSFGRAFLSLLCIFPPRVLILKTPPGDEREASSLGGRPLLKCRMCVWSNRGAPSHECSTRWYTACRTCRHGGGPSWAMFSSELPHL